MDHRLAADSASGLHDSDICAQGAWRLSRYLRVEKPITREEWRDLGARQRRKLGRSPGPTPYQLPDFSLDGYAGLIVRLREAGYRFAPAGAMRSVESRPTLYLRHDIDLHLVHVDRMAELEASLGVSATYYLALTQPYNVMSSENGALIGRLIELGHEIGLHYDLVCYPTDPDEALERLDWEVSVLERVSGTAVRSICMHQPHTGLENLFAIGGRWLNPHDPRLAKGLMYVSDSCRAWRDESLLRCLGDDPPTRVMLNTHPEVWLDGSILERERYLDEVVMRNATEQPRRYIDETVRALWRHHAGGRAHDARAGIARELA